MVKRPERTRPTGRSVATVAVRAALTVLLVVVSTIAPAAAQTADNTGEPSGLLSFESISPWVAPEGTWTARFRTTGVGLDASVVYSVRQTLDADAADLPDVLTRLADGDLDALTGPQQPPVSVPITEVIDSTGLVTLRVDVRDERASDDDRLYLPRSGIHPIVLGVVNAAGTTLEEHVLFLNHLPSDSRMPTSIGMIASVTGGPTVDTTGTVALSPTDRDRLESLAGIAEEFDEAPLNVDVDPELLVALAASTLPEDNALLVRLRRALEDAWLVTQSWVPLDAEQWARSGTRDEYERNLNEGGRAIGVHLGQLPTLGFSLDDPSVGPTAVQSLQRLGIERFVVDAGRGFEPGVRTEVAGADVVAIDTRTEAVLDGASSPAIAAHVALTTLYSRWQEQPDDPPVSILRATDREPDVLAALLEQLRNYPGGPFATETLDEVFDRAPDTDGRDDDETDGDDDTNDDEAPSDQWDGTETAGAAAGIWRIADELRERSGAVNSMLGDGSDTATRISFQMNSILHRGLSEEEQATRAIDTAAAIDLVLDAFSTPDRRSVTVTSRETSIPIRITNDLDTPANVLLEFDSPRVQFIDGDTQQLTLEPGVNRLEIPVVVRSSGGFLLTFDVRSADDAELLTTGEVSIRSTAFSGVGLILSGGAILVLAAWWWRTLRTDDEDDDLDDEPAAT